MSDERPPARVLDFFSRPARPAPPPAVLIVQRCICEHTQDAHIAGSGACRPGFVCLAHCQIFRAKGRA